MSTKIDFGTREEFGELLLTKLVSEIAKDFGTYPSTVWRAFAREKIGELPDFVEMGISEPQKLSTYIRISRELASGKEQGLYKYFTLKGMSEYDKDSQKSAGIFECGLCGGKSVYTVSMLKYSKNTRKFCVHCNDILGEQNLRYCNDCDEILPVERFLKTRASNVCNECKSIKAAKREPGMIVRQKILQFKNRVYHTDIPINIDFEDLGMTTELRTIKKREVKVPITWPTHCPVLGIELNWAYGGKKHMQPNSPSIDKIIPELGYIPGNAQIVSMKYNTMKQDSTPEQRQKVAEYWIQGKA